MSLSATGKISLKSSKGDVEIEVYAREVPVVKQLMKSCLSGQLNGNLINYNEEVNVISVDIAVEEFVITRNNRLRFEKGTVALSKSQMVINLSDSLVLDNEAVIIGKIVGQSIYTLNKVKDQEFDCIIQSVAAPVVYYTDLKVAVEKDIDTQPEKPQKKRKTKPKKVALSYYDEDVQQPGEQFKMISSYDVNKTKPDPENAAANKSIEDTDRQIQEEPSLPTTTEPLSHHPSPKQDPQAKPISNQSKSQLTPLAPDSQIPQKPVNQPSTSTQKPTATTQKYKDIPISTLRSHKYIIKR